MSEKEKETIEDCKELVQELKQHKDKDFIGRLYYKSKPVEDILSVLLNLIEKQQKELNNLKEIEKSHQEENGKLRVEVEKQKETNKAFHHFIVFNGGKDIEDVTATKYIQIRQEGYIEGRHDEQQKFEEIIVKNYISKDKIKDMMKYRKFELQQQYKDFEEDAECKTYKKILEDK